MKPKTIEIEKKVKKQFLKYPGYVQQKLNEMFPDNLGFSEGPEKILVFFPEDKVVTDEDKQKLSQLFNANPEPRVIIRIEEDSIESNLPESIKRKLVNKGTLRRPLREGEPLRLELMFDEELTPDEIEALQKIDWRETTKKYKVYRVK